MRVELDLPSPTINTLRDIAPNCQKSSQKRGKKRKKGPRNFLSESSDENQIACSPAGTPTTTFFKFNFSSLLNSPSNTSENEQEMEIQQEHSTIHPHQVRSAHENTPKSSLGLGFGRGTLPRTLFLTANADRRP